MAMGCSSRHHPRSPKSTCDRNNRIGQFCRLNTHIRVKNAISANIY